MPDPSDRDRVTAIEAAIAKQLERDYYPVAPAIAKSVMRTPALLEALDTIDKLEGENAGGPLMSAEVLVQIIVGRIKTGFGRQVGDEEARRIGEWVVNGYPWDSTSPDAATWQALNGGNE